ncbi:MAG: response regulator [Armatimonadetes bacterium]|nr:response regulator [Armatimonadota bacterium]
MTAAPTPVRLLAAHALPHLTAALTRAAARSADIALAGACRDGEAACALAETLEPDVISLDVALPRLSGPTAIGAIVSWQRRRIVVTATAGCGFTEDIVACLDAGAVDFACRRPEHLWTSPPFIGALLDRVRLAARVPRERLRPRAAASLLGALASRPGETWVVTGDVGAPGALVPLITALPSDVPATICVALSLPAAITRALAHYLAARAAVPVREARQGDFLTPGSVLILPGSCLASLRPARDGRPTIHLEARHPGPQSGEALDRTLAAFAAGTRAHLVVLSGAGPDGARGAEAILSAGGAVYTAAPECGLLAGLADAVRARAGAAGRACAELPVARRSGPAAEAKGELMATARAA